MTSQETTTGSEQKPDVKRRGMMSGVGLTALAAGAIAATGASMVAATPAQAQGITDADIFNFALNLEYLEAEFYVRAVTGQGLGAADVTGTGTQGQVSGGGAVPFKADYVRQYATKIAVDELTHVRFIRTVLGSSRVARTSIDFGSSFTNLAIAAGLIVPGQTFNPFADDVSFLLGAFIFEDVGVTAYGGAANLITDRSLVAYAASVLAVEAYHAGAVRTLLANIGAGDAVNKITALRAKLSGANDEVALTIPGNNYNFAPTDQQAQTFRRTPRQVLNIVYGAANASSGLFFPIGMNGTIRS